MDSLHRELLKVENLSVDFAAKQGTVHAVRDVSFQINTREIIGVVGESGCGKSTLGRTLLKIYEPDGGSIYFNGTDITNLSYKQMHPYRRKMQMIFQDPYASLNPRFTVGEMIEEPMKVYNMYDKKTRMERVQELMKTVGLKPDHIRRYPHEFSALDVSIQAQNILVSQNFYVIPCDTQIVYYLFAGNLSGVTSNDRGERIYSLSCRA